MDIEARKNKIMTHIDFVQRNMARLANHDKIGAVFGLQLARNSYLHDNSKLWGVEFEYLNEDTKQDKPELFLAALNHHRKTNKHHPEFWPQGIWDMPQVYIAEMVCDCVARGQELCTDLEDWFSVVMPKKYNFGENDKVFDDIQKYFSYLKGTL